MRHGKIITRSRSRQLTEQRFNESAAADGKNIAQGGAQAECWVNGKNNIPSPWNGRQTFDYRLPPAHAGLIELDVPVPRVTRSERSTLGFILSVRFADSLKRFFRQPSVG